MSNIGREFSAVQEGADSSTGRRRVFRSADDDEESSGSNDAGTQAMPDVTHQNHSKNSKADNRTSIIRGDSIHSKGNGKRKVSGTWDKGVERKKVKSDGTQGQKLIHIHPIR